MPLHTVQTILLFFILVVVTIVLLSMNPQASLCRTRLALSLDNIFFSSSEEEYTPCRKRILILAEGRSGSTITAQLLDHSEEVFFMDEPRVNAWTLPAAFRCLFALDETFLRGVFWICGRSKECSKVLVSNQWQNLDELQHINSRQRLELFRRCTERHRLIKFIDPVNFTDLVPMLDGDDQFYVVHLMRDPRAVLNSRLQVAGWITNPNNITEEAVRLCQEMRAKFNLASQLHHRYRLFRYEDLARDMITFAAELYRFVELEVPPTLDVMIYQHTNSSNGDRRFNPYGTYRQNASVAVNAWRQELSPSIAHTVGTVCGDVLDKLGYI